MRTVSFIGIGAQKSASTWLYGALAQFPDVYVSDPKELDFFSGFFDRGYEWYERFFEPGKPCRLRGEVSPSYFIAADAPARARAYNPDMKVLVTLRDPVDRAFSNHLHEVRAGHVSGGNLSFETALENNPLYLNQGLYARHLGRWMAEFPKDQIHVTFQEDVKADSTAQTARLGAFMGADLPDQFVQRRANESIDYKNRTLGTALWRVGRAARKAGFGGIVETIKELPGVREMRKANQKDLRQHIDPMRAETVLRLTDHFRDDVAELEAVLGVKVPWRRFAGA